MLLPQDKNTSVSDNFLVPLGKNTVLQPVVVSGKRLREKSLAEDQKNEEQRVLKGDTFRVYGRDPRDMQMRHYVVMPRFLKHFGAPDLRG